MASSKLQAYGLAEVYSELGRYSFKVVLNPRHFKSGQDFEVSLVDPDRRPMRSCLYRWGRKLNIEFEIGPDTPDGVAVVIVSRAGTEVGRLSFWVVK